jgi:hypothetical protein
LPLLNLILVFLVFLVPLAIYCVILALMNRRPRPVMVRGVWDCVGLLFASSGFLLVVAPALLRKLYAQSLPHEELISAEVWTQWWAITLSYYGIVVVLIGALLWWRSGTTVIYNVDGDRFDAALARTLQQLGLSATGTGGELFITPGVEPSVTVADDSSSVEVLYHEDEASGAHASQRAPLATHHSPRDRRPSRHEGAEAHLFIDRFSSLSNVSIHWRTADAALRTEIEERLAENLEMARLDDNPAGTWLMGISIALFFVIFLSVLLLLMLGTRPRQTAAAVTGDYSPSRSARVSDPAGS